MMAELESVVRVDFSGFSQAAQDSKDVETNVKNTSKALRDARAVAFTGGFGAGSAGGGWGGGGNRQAGGHFFIQRANIFIQNANIVIQKATVSQTAAAMRVPREPRDAGKDSGQTALLALAASSSAFVWKAAALANPAAVERFQDAIADTTAVIGHQLIPALNWMTRQVREVGDWLARNPTAAKGIGVGAVGLAALATVGLVANVAKQAVSGLGWLAKGAGRLGGLFGMGGGAATTATSADMAAGRVLVNAGGTTPPGRPGFFARMGGSGALSRFGGLAAAAGLAYETPGAFRDKDPFNILNRVGGVATMGLWSDMGEDFKKIVGQERTRSMQENYLGWRGMFSWTKKYLGTDFGVDPYKNRNKFDASGKLIDTEKLAAAELEKRSSWGAAARPTQYMDILSSVTALRQSISSAAGLDPNERTATATERTADAVEALRDGRGGGPAAGPGGVGGGLGWQDIINAMMRGEGFTPRSG